MGSEKTVIGATLEIEGEIEGGEDLVILGSVTGKVISSENLSIEASGKIDV